jgi:LPXTG-motif cell wall-anchored protein
LRTLSAAPQGVAAALPLAGLALLGGLAAFVRRRKA